MCFSQIINEASLLEQEFIKAKYSRIMPYYQTTVEFLTWLNLISVDEQTIIIETRYRELLQEVQTSDQPTEVVGKYLTRRMFDQPNDLREYINQFLSKFSLRGERYEFKPTLKQKLEYSGIRNFLMELHLIDYDLKESKYVIEDPFVIAYPELNEGHLVSEKSFKNIQNLREKIGRAAEEVILKYEKDRLYEFPHLADKIEHIAVKDVSAGYDIKSFEQGKDGEIIPRLIEVKAVSSWNYRFYWTKNEIESSRLNRTTYYLYLLPVYTKNAFDITRMKIIKDPFMNVYNNEDIWAPTIETMSYTLGTDTLMKEAS